jgi:hypothetical protein
MKYYATVRSERAGRHAQKGGDKEIVIDLSKGNTDHLQIVYKGDTLLVYDKVRDTVLLETKDLENCLHYGCRNKATSAEGSCYEHTFCDCPKVDGKYHKHYKPECDRLKGETQTGELCHTCGTRLDKANPECKQHYNADIPL